MRSKKEILIRTTRITRLSAKIKDDVKYRKRLSMLNTSRENIFYLYRS